MLDIRKAVKHLMIDRNLKAKEMAERIGVSSRGYSNWLYKSDSPRLNTVESILAELGCHLAIVDDESGKILFD